jgi:putative transposase
MGGKVPHYSEEFRRDAVALALSSDKTVTAVARDLGVSPEGLRNWVKKAKAERGVPAELGGEPSLTAAERAELRELRRKVKAQEETISILKKPPPSSRTTPVEAFYRFIDAQKAHHAVAALCRDLQVSRSAYYQWHEQAAARLARIRAEEALLAEIALVHAASRGAYGVPRVHAQLRRHGHLVNRKKVERIMRENHITGITRRTGRRCLTRQERSARFAPDFTARVPGTRLVGDVTYIPTDEGWLFWPGDWTWPPGS